MKVWPLNQTLKHSTWQFITSVVIAIRAALGTRNSSKTHCLPAVAIKTGGNYTTSSKWSFGQTAKRGDPESPLTLHSVTSLSLIKLAIKISLLVKHISFLGDENSYVHEFCLWSLRGKLYSSFNLKNQKRPKHFSRRSNGRKTWYKKKFYLLHVWVYEYYLISG